MVIVACEVDNSVLMQMFLKYFGGKQQILGVFQKEKQMKCCLSDPGEPGVRSLGLDVHHSLTD